MPGKPCHSTASMQEASYFPLPGHNWAHLEPEEAGMRAEPLTARKEFAAAHAFTTTDNG